MHPLVKLLTLVFFIILSQKLGLKMQWLLSLMLIALAWVLQAKSAIKLFKRSRLIMFVMFALLALNTPGEYVSTSAFIMYQAFIPTYEGLQVAFRQVLVFGNMLLLLAIFLTITPREDLISGLYLCMLPLKSVGFDPQRFAARVWLTLYYVEHIELNNMQSILSEINAIKHHQMPNSMMERITMRIPELQFLDMVVMLFVMAGMIYIV